VEFVIAQKSIALYVTLVYERFLYRVLDYDGICGCICLSQVLTRCMCLWDLCSMRNYIWLHSNENSFIYLLGCT